MNRIPARWLVAAPAALLVVPLLAGCSAGTAPDAATEAGCVAPGSASESIRVAGDFGENLDLTSPVPVRADRVERSVLEAGEGAQIAEGDTFVGHLNIFVGSTGDPYSQDGTRQVLDPAALAPWYFDLVRCSHAGDRVAGTVPAIDLLGEGGGEASGIADDDTMVVVVDLRAVLSPGAGRATGNAQALPAGFPTITLSDTGEPTIELPAELASATEFRAAASIVGDGAPVVAEDTVLVHVRGLIARTGEAFEESWGGAPISYPLDRVPAGLRDGLVGQTVGSQVVIIVPPGSGYTGEELEMLGYQPTDVIVYVVDILAAG